MITSLGFKYEFLIESVSTLLSMLTDQLLSIFIIKEDCVITFLRNHPASNIPMLINLLTEYIRNHYSTNVATTKKTIQQAIDSTIQQLRCYQQPYDHKKYVIFSDFTNFGYGGFQTFDLWDTQGYTFSLNGVLIGSWKLNGYETFKLVVDPQVIQDYLQNMNGELYDVNLCNRQGELIEINECQQTKLGKNAETNSSNTKLNIGEYQIKYPEELYQMRKKEGFKEETSQILSIRVNYQIKLLYQLTKSTVSILIERTAQIERVTNQQKKAAEADTDILSNAKRLFEIYKQRDYLQEVVLDMKKRVLSIEDAMMLLVKSKAFENQKFVNRNFKQISLVFVIRAINFRQYQEEGEEFNKSQFYLYIRQKVQEVATKSLQNCLLYQQGQDFVIIRIIWHSHTILRLICIYENADMLPNVQSRLKEVFKSNQILRNSLIQFDHSLKNLLISSETHQLKKNPDICVLESQWEWPKQLIWDMQQMYRILASLRVKSNYLRVPSEGDRTNKFFVAQMDLENQAIVVVQNLILLDDRIICNVFVENLMTDVRQILVDYFQKIKEHEKQIIISLHTAHSMYRNALVKKLNSPLVDFFSLQFVSRPGKSFKSKDQIISAFRECAQAQILSYPQPTIQLNYESLLTKAYNYSEIKQKYIEDSKSRLVQGYLQVLQSITDYAVLRAQSNLNKDLLFMAIGPQRMLLIVYENQSTTFYLISMEQIERNHNSHPFLNALQEKKIDQLINYVQQEYNAVFAKEIHQLFMSNSPNQHLNSAIEGCQIQSVEFDLYDVYQNVRMLFDQPSRKILRKSIIADESPVKGPKKMNSMRLNDIKQQFLTLTCRKWDDRLQALMSDNKVSLKLIEKKYYSTPMLSLIYYYDKQEKNVNILFVTKSLKEGEQEFENIVQLIDSQRIKQKRTKIVIQYSICHYEAKNWNKILNEDCDCPVLNYLDDQTSVSLKIQRWADPFRKYNHIFMKQFELEMKRLLPINYDNIENISLLVEAMETKVIEFSISDKKFDNSFSTQFIEEMKSTSELNPLLQYLNPINEQYIFVMTIENCNLPQFDEFQLEKEYLSDEIYVVPFWFIVSVKEQQFQIISYTEYAYESIKETISQLRTLILETIETTLLYIQIRRATESSQKVRLILKPNFEIDADTPAMPEPVKPAQQAPAPQTFQRRALWRQNTVIENKTEVTKEYMIPFVGWRVFQPFQPKKPYVEHLVNNTILMNHKIEQNQYYGYLDKKYYLFMFQPIKSIQNYAERYPELCADGVSGQLAIVMNVYSTNKNSKKITQDIDYFYEHIKNYMDEDTINALSQGIIRNPRLKDLEYQQMQRGEHCYMEILLNSGIKDLLAFSVFMRHNLEKTFFKYEVQVQEKEKSKSEVYKDDLKFIVDQHENSFIFSKYKVVQSPNVNMSSFFGQGLCLLNFLYSVDSGIVTSYQFPKQPKCVQQDEMLNIPHFLPGIQMHNAKRAVQCEMSYDITKEYEVKFLVIDIIYRGQLEWEKFKEYFQVLVRQVELEYSLECLQQKNSNPKDIEYTFRKLQHYSFKMHHFVYPLHYEEVLWSSVKTWIRQKILNEAEKKGITQGTLQPFESHFTLKGPILGYSPMTYLIQDTLESDAIDALKHYTAQKVKKNDPADLYHRGLLIYVKLSNTLEIFLYNVNWDVAASLNHQLGILSRWSIIRNLVAQKMKNDLCACYNIVLSPLYEEIYIAKHTLYQPSIVNDLHRLRSQEQPQSKSKLGGQKKEGQIDQFISVSKAIECLVQNEFPTTEYQLFEFVKHLDQFFKLNLCMVKPKKLASIQGEGDFLQREGRAYLELLKDFYKNFIQMQLILFVKKIQLKTFSQVPQTKTILDRVLNQSTELYTNVLPLYIFRLKDKPGLKGALDLEKEYQSLIDDAYQRVIKQKNFDIFFGDDAIMEEQANDEERDNKKAIFLSEDDLKGLMTPIDLNCYFSDSMLKEVNLQVQNSEVCRRVNYLRKKDNPSIIKVITLISFKYLFIFEKLYCLPGQDMANSQIVEDYSLFLELEQYHSELIEFEWKKNEKQIDMYLLLNGYNKIYQKFNMDYPKCENVLYKINVGFVLDWIKLDDFIKFIRLNSHIYYLNKVHNFHAYEPPNMISKSDQLSISLYLGLLGLNDKFDSKRVIELELDEQQQGSKQLTIVVYLLINSEHTDQFLSVFENSIIETLKRAHKNFMAFQWWSKIKVNQQLTGQDLGFLIQYCQQIQTKKLAKEIRFEQLDESYRQKPFLIDKFITRIPFQWCLVGNKKSLIIVNSTQDVLYIIDFQENMIDNIRILYLIMDNPQYDQERMIKPHFDECTQLIKKFIDEMI